MAKVRIGDLIEIQTHKGLFYAQYTHDDPDYGELIQVCKTCFRKRPNLIDIAIEDVGIITFFPLNAAIRMEIFTVIGNIDVPEELRAFPVFRVRGYMDKHGTVKQWKFWNGKNTWPIAWLTELTEEQKKLPIRGSWNDTLLIERLQEGWTPEQYSVGV